jgi:hypothetical protein
MVLVWGFDMGVKRGLKYVSLLKIFTTGKSLYITCTYAIAPAGEEILAVLGEDRILYTAIDTEIGKEYAARIVKGVAPNVEKIKVTMIRKIIGYNIPMRFAKALNIEKGDYVLAVSERDGVLEVIPLHIAMEKIGRFRETPIL